MYIRTTTRKYKDRVYTNHLLVESVMTDKGPRQRTICSLGDLGPKPLEGWLTLARRLEAALLGQMVLFEDEPDPVLDAALAKVHAKRKRLSEEAADAPKTVEQSGGEQLVRVAIDRVAMEESREAGPAHAGHQFFQRLELPRILADVGLDAKAVSLTELMVLNRLIGPASEHAMPHWARTSAIGDILPVDVAALYDEKLYRNMDELAGHTADIEKQLAAVERNLFNLDDTVFLYDLTSTYFEGDCPRNEQAKRGYSRDKRPDCKQVVVGLVVNRDGFPRAHEVFDGNRQDRTTVDEMLSALERRVGKPAVGTTVVVDRGMAFDENLEQIVARGYSYLVAARQSERGAWLDAFEDDGDWQQLTPSSAKGPTVRIKSRERDGLTWLLCVSEGRTKKDRAIREKQEQRFLTDVAKLQKRIVAGRLKNRDKIHVAIGRLAERYPRVARYYRLQLNEDGTELSFDVLADKRAKAEELDGSYLMKTNRKDLQAEEIWRTYMLLARAENAFRDMKSPLSERPIFHHLARRVQVHIFLCVLAYHLLVAIETTLLRSGCPLSWERVRDTLKTHQIATIVLPADNGDVLKIRKGTVPEPEHVQIYDALDIPHQPVRERRLWLRPRE